MQVKFSAPRKAGSQVNTVLIPDVRYASLVSASVSSEEVKAAKKHLDGEGKRDLYVLNQLSHLTYITRAPKNPSYMELEKYRQLGARIWAYMKLGGVDKIQIQDLYGNPEILFALAEGLALAAYEFAKYLTDTRDRVPLREIAVIGAGKEFVSRLNACVKATYKARDLGNEPVNYLSAKKLSEEIAEMGREAGFKFEHFNKKKIESLKMGGLLAVNQASPFPPTFNILEYKHPKAVNKKPVVFVGKGVTFDTGGVSLKPAGGMDKMKSDMSGAAAVAASIYGIALEGLPVHVVGLIPATDNRIGSNAIVPGDIITTYAGKTVEVLNTDAEGRLILADALHYARKYDPSLVIDLATLTGAAVMAVGEYGIISMEKEAHKGYDILNEASENVYERLVKLPLWEEYDDLIKSPIADLKNIGGSQAGAITAGKFLEHFTAYPWIHLDLSNAIIDKTSYYRTLGATGAGTRLLIEFARNLHKL